MSADVTFKVLLEQLAEQRGFDYRGYKKTTLERRFRKRMFELNIGNYAEYGEYVQQTPDEATALLNTILINVTEFFRDPPAWEVLRAKILPPAFRHFKPGTAFRAWSAGCASGEEAYSIAIILSDFFGQRLPEFDVKIYATDVDDEALTVARRGEYPAEALRRIRPEWRERYFGGKGTMRVNREIRRLVIFGRSNLVQDAPISHVDLLLCRNVLIYFDSDLQRQVLARMHYALEPGGILFLGKAESQLTSSMEFRRLDSRWRIFQRITPKLGADDVIEPAPLMAEKEKALSLRAREELDALRSQQRYMLETLQLGVLVLTPDDTIVQNNSSMLVLHGLPPTNLAGKRLPDTDLFAHMPDLNIHLQASRLNNETTRFQSRVKVAGQEHLLEVTLRPLLDQRGSRSGTLVYCEDVTVQEKLQTAVEELESTSEELQSANEELETTNEELQSTNEELETTNEELQSLNEELETTNQELEERGKDLDQINSLYAQTLEKIRLPVMLVNSERHIEFWNNMALQLFGFRSKPPIEFRLEQLPLAESLRDVIIRRVGSVLLKQRPVIIRNIELPGKVYPMVDIHFTVVEREDHGSDVLIMYEPRAGTPNRNSSSKPRSPKPATRNKLRKKKKKR